MDNFKVNDIQAALTSPIDNKQQVQQSENFKFTLISRIAESELQEKLSANLIFVRVIQCTVCQKETGYTIGR